MKKRIYFAFLGLGLSAGPAFALDADVAKDTTGSAAAAWAAIGDFCGIASWHPAVAKCEPSEKDGVAMRMLTLQDGGKILERQTARDDKAMSYSYEIVESPLPVANYKSTIRVVPKDSGATIDWSGTFDAKGASDSDAMKTITGIYQAGVDSLVAKSSK